MNCADVSRVLDPYLDGAVDPAAELEIERHLEGCPSCAGAARGHRSLRRAFRQAVRDEYAVPSGLEDRVRAALAQSAAGGSRAPNRRHVYRYALAAAALIVIAGAWMIRTGGGPPGQRPARGPGPSPAASEIEALDHGGRADIEKVKVSEL